MPVIEFACPSCHATVKAPEQAAGKAARCPKCRQKCTVPEPFPENASFDFQQLTAPETSGQEDESIIRPSLRRSNSSLILCLSLAGTFVLVLALGIMFLALPHRLQDQANDRFEERYQQLCKRESDLIDRSMRLFDRMKKTEEPKAQKDLCKGIQLAHIELEDVYAQMQGTLQDRIASNGGRPGDHYKLEKIAQQRENLKGLRQTLEAWIFMKEMQKRIRDGEGP